MKSNIEEYLIGIGFKKLNPVSLFYYKKIDDIKYLAYKANNIEKNDVWIVTDTNNQVALVNVNATKEEFIHQVKKIPAIHNDIRLEKIKQLIKR